MRKSKIISGLLALALVCTTALPMNINTASAAANTQGNDNVQVEIKEQEPVEITEFDSAGECDAQAVGEKVEFDKSDVKHFKTHTSHTQTTPETVYFKEFSSENSHAACAKPLATDKTLCK